MLEQLKLAVKSLQQRLAIKLKILFSFYQIVTKIGETYAVVYPEKIERILKFFAFTNLELDGMGLPLACIGLGSFQAKLIGAMVLPFGLVLFFAGVVWSRRRLAKSRSADEERRRRTARESGVLDRDFVSAIIPDLELLEVAQHGQSGRLGHLATRTWPQSYLEGTGPPSALVRRGSAPRLPPRRRGTSAPSSSTLTDFGCG